MIYWEARYLREKKTSIISRYHIVARLVSLNNRAILLIVVLLLTLLSNPMIGYAKEINAHPTITVLVYPDSTIELIYMLSGHIPLRLNTSSGYLDYTFNYGINNDTISITIVGGGELVYGKPSGTPINHSIVFIGLNTDTRSSSRNKSARTMGILIVNIDENINGTPSHLTLNASRIIVNSTPESINLSFILEIRGEANLSLLDQFLGYNLSELNGMLASKGFNWIRFISYEAAAYNNTYKITGSMTINLSILITTMLDQSLLSENQVDEISTCITSLYSDTSIKTRLAQAYWSEEYSNANRIGVKTELVLTLRGNTSVLENIGSCLPVYAKLLSAMIPGLPNITIPRIDLAKYARIPGLIPIQPYSFYANIKLDAMENDIEFNLTIYSGRLLYNASSLPPNVRIEKTLEVVKNYLENLTAILEPYRIMLGVEHLIPASISVKGVSINGFRVLVEPETIELFKPVELNVSIVKVSPTTSTTITQTKPIETLTTTITVTKTVKETYTVTKTIESTATITTPTVVRETVTETVRTIDTRALVVSITVAVIVSVTATYILVQRKTKTS